MKSIWTENNTLPSFGTIEKDMKTDVLVIGGGITGILIAYMLEEYGIDCILAEADTICSGMTENTTAKITSQHGLIYGRLIKEFGMQKAKLYFEINEKALKTYGELCRTINCTFERKSSYVYSLSDREKLDEERAALKLLGYNTEIIQSPPLPFHTAGALRFESQAQFDPLRFVSHICSGLPIFEHSKITGISGTHAYTERHKIQAKRIIVATHFPFINRHGSYFLKMYQQRSYVIALENAEMIDGMYIDEADGGLSLRSFGQYLFVGGGGHRTGKSGGSFNVPESFASKYYPDAKVKYRWAAQDCITLDKMPYIGQYSKNTEGLFVATGFNKWGMTSAMVSAMILSDMMIGKHNPYAELFSPSRTMLRPQLAVNGFEAAVSLLTPSAKRCPHMGCALKWNAAERTWDCPCHGSRFEENGNLIDNPATGDLKK